MCYSWEKPAYRRYKLSTQKAISCHAKIKSLLKIFISDRKLKICLFNDLLKIKNRSLMSLKSEKTDIKTSLKYIPLIIIK